jgi:hypothetical protein
MSLVFADTSYYVALVSNKDQWHDIAMEVSRDLFDGTVTTEFVLTEVGNFLHRPPDRELFRVLMVTLRSDDQTIIVPASSHYFEAGLHLFLERADKAWSLTDCISFITMQEQGIADVLSSDRHFEQAGFRLLMQPKT